MEITKIEPRTFTYRLVPNKEDPEYMQCMWARFIFDCDNGRLKSTAMLATILTDGDTTNMRILCTL